MRPRSLTCAVFVMLLGVFTAVTQAGDGRVSVLGHRVRITAPDVSPTRIDGTVIGVDEETLRVVTGDDRTLAISRSQILRLDVARGKKSRASRDAVIGGVAGLLGGLVLSNPPSSSTHFQVDGAAMMGSAAFGALGGALSGAFKRTDRWTTVPIDAVAVNAAPSPAVASQ